jgi:G3E family GTPase
VRSPQSTAASRPELRAHANAAVPLTLLTGFLGAGKTTLVNRLLGGNLGMSFGVLVNDFGALDIDRALITGEADGVLSLSNGCLCCSLRGDLVGAVMRLLGRPDAPQRVLLEASGVADPVPIAGTFMAPAFRHRLRLDGVVCVVDAEQALARPELVPLQLRQIGFSDLVLLNKTDLAGPDRVQAITARIRAEFAGARILESVRCEVPAEVLFSSAPAMSEPWTGPPATEAADHARQFDAWAFETLSAFSRDALHELARRLPPSVYRAKGIVRLASGNGSAGLRGVLQIVGRRSDLVADRDWLPADGPSRLAFIGAASQLQARQLDRLVRDCLRPGD